MFIVILVIHVLVSIMLILFILLQTGKGADLGAMLGGGGANTLFGATGATSFLSKLTTYSAVIFMITCLTLAYLSSRNPSTMDGAPSPVAPISDTITPEGDTPENNAADAGTETDGLGEEVPEGEKSATPPATTDGADAPSTDSGKEKTDAVKTE